MAGKRRNPPIEAGRTTLVTLQQGSAETGIPYTSLRKLVLDGHLARVRLGVSKRTWIRREDLDRLIATSVESF